MKKICLNQELKEILKGKLTPEQYENVVKYLKKGFCTISVPYNLKELVECNDEFVAKFILNSEQISHINMKGQDFLENLCIYIWGNLEFLNKSFDTAFEFRVAELVMRESNIENVIDYSFYKFNDEAYYNKDTDSYDTDECPNWIIQIFYNDNTVKELLYNQEADDYVIRNH